MKFLCGRINRICILIVSILFAISASTVFADESRIEFILKSNNCGGTVIQAISGEARLSASADGVNSKKENLIPRRIGQATGKYNFSVSLSSLQGI